MANPSKFYGGPPHLATKTVTFTATGAGASAAATALFTVTGQVLIEALVPYCETSLTQDGATPDLALGVVGNTAIFLGATTATAIDAGKFWLDTSPAEVGAMALPAALKQIAVCANIQCLVGGTNNINAGVIRFSCLWRPLAAGSKLVAA